MYKGDASTYGEYASEMMGGGIMGSYESSHDGCALGTGGDVGSTGAWSWP